MRRLVAMAGVLLGTSCSDFTPPAEPLTLQLTATQATNLNDRLGSFAAADGDLAWLADSVNLIVRAGTTIVEADLDTDFGTGPFYGVGLHRAVATSGAPFSTFHAVLFNDPSNPTHVIVLSGWAEGVPAAANGSGMGSNIPTQVSWVSANAHFFKFDGTGVSHWRGLAGHVAFSLQSPRGACPDFVATATLTCELAELNVIGTVSSSARESGSADGAPLLVLYRSDFNGIRLRFTAP